MKMGIQSKYQQTQALAETCDGSPLARTTVQENFGEWRKPAWLWAFAANAGLLDLISKALLNPSFLRRQETKQDFPQTLRLMANLLVFQVFRLFQRASGDSGLDACLRRHDDVENGSWTLLRLRGDDEKWVLDSLTRSAPFARRAGLWQDGARSDVMTARPAKIQSASELAQDEPDGVFDLDAARAMAKDAQAEALEKGRCVYFSGNIDGTRVIFRKWRDGRVEIRDGEDWALWREN